MKKLIIFLLALCFSVAVSADITKDARKSVELNGDSVLLITVMLKTSISFNGVSEDPDEQTNNICGTVIDKSGLIVTSLTSINPMIVLDTLLADSMKAQGLTIDSSFTSIRVRMPSGELIDADVVVKDKDLDLAFLKLRTLPEKPLTVAEIAESPNIAMFDKLVLMNRMSSAGNYNLNSMVETVNCVLEKPRRLYYMMNVNNRVGAGLGGYPAFTADGKLLGVLVSYINPDLRMENERETNQGICAIQPLADAKKLIETAKEVKP